MAHTSEKALNALVAQALEWRHPRWKVNAEQSGVLAGQLGRAPDIVITPSGDEAGSPVLIETEYEPAGTVDSDACARLGSALTKSGYVVEHVLALRMPIRLADVSPADLPDGAVTDRRGHHARRRASDRHLAFISLPGIDF